MQGRGERGLREVRARMALRGETRVAAPGRAWHGVGAGAAWRAAALVVAGLLLALSAGAQAELVHKYVSQITGRRRASHSNLCAASPPTRSAANCGSPKRAERLERFGPTNKSRRRSQEDEVAHRRRRLQHLARQRPAAVRGQPGRRRRQEGTPERGGLRPGEGRRRRVRIRTAASTGRAPRPEPSWARVPSATNSKPVAPCTSRPRRRARSRTAKTCTSSSPNRKSSTSSTPRANTSNSLRSPRGAARSR